MKTPIQMTPATKEDLLYMEQTLTQAIANSQSGKIHIDNMIPVIYKGKKICSFILTDADLEIVKD
jgi:hypothetical protein